MATCVERSGERLAAVFAASLLRLERVAAVARLRSARAALEAGGDASVAEARLWAVAREILYGNLLSGCHWVIVDVCATRFRLRWTLELTETPQKVLRSRIA